MEGDSLSLKFFCNQGIFVVHITHMADFWSMMSGDFVKIEGVGSNK